MNGTGRHLAGMRIGIFGKGGSGKSTLTVLALEATVCEARRVAG